MTIGFQEIPLAAWSLLLSQGQQFLNNHLARVPVTPDQQRTNGKTDEDLWSVGAQDMDTCGYQVSADPDQVEIYWETAQLDVDAVFRPRIDISIWPTAFDDLEIGGSAENPIQLNGEADKNNSPTPKTTVSEWQTRPSALLRSCPFGTRIEINPDYVQRICFNKFCRVGVLMQKSINLSHFIITFSKN